MNEEQQAFKANEQHQSFGDISINSKKPQAVMERSDELGSGMDEKSKYILVVPPDMSAEAGPESAEQFLSKIKSLQTLASRKSTELSRQSVFEEDPSTIELIQERPMTPKQIDDLVQIIQRNTDSASVASKRQMMSIDPFHNLTNGVLIDNQLLLSLRTYKKMNN